jgi:hypothetical protein
MSVKFVKKELKEYAEFSREHGIFLSFLETAGALTESTQFFVLPQLEWLIAEPNLFVNPTSITWPELGTDNDNWNTVIQTDLNISTFIVSNF